MSGDDPEAYLRPSREKDTIDPTRMFDTKKWTWVPDEEEGFKSATVKSQKGERLVVELDGGQEVEVDLNATQQMNPPKFEKIEDMAGLTYLNEASVLHNLRQRYYSSLIYTYSGLFCVAVNPYRKLPIYTNNVINMYRGKRKTEMPPHIFSISDNAYRDMLQDRENQSILITGESGAGKTENTKKVIQYFALIAPNPSTTKHTNLEEQVIQANPVLEAFGNAKTIRNDNSSRFGKFIRIHFGPQGKIAGADIEFYLLEKSRVIHQQHGERCYHIFYQLLAGGSQELLNDLLLTRQVKSYIFLANSEVTVDNVDDAREFNSTKEAMVTLGFTDEELMSMFKTISGILHFGNIEVKQRPREEWATIPNTTEAEKVAHLLGMQAPDLMKALIKPRIRVGNEYVQQGRNQEQVRFSIGALSKAMYQRMFKWLVTRINKTLDTKSRRNFFIGVLDIAGFEIFQVNSFEQLCINLTNEKLQQFFNHHMFVLEQEEYRKEGIKWEFIDFGLDLQPSVDLIEKPMGVLALLDEECLFPKGSDKSYLEKLNKTHADKSPNFLKAERSRAQMSEFEIAHYAGTVCYTVTGWLNKNKDPLNDSVVDLLKKSTDPFVSGLWADYSLDGERARGKKGSQFVTVGQVHKQSLHHLLTTLRNTTPNFVRCIIPNELKKAGMMDAHLVLHQLRCNGVLEGIRICRKGFPNRLFYAEFRQRYAILAPKAIPAGFMDGRKACELLLEALQLENNEFRLGNSKVFFKAGVLGRLEGQRDVQMGIVLTAFQSRCRGYLMRKLYRKLIDQRLAIAVLQRNIRKYLFLRDWKWWKLYTKVKPLLNVARTEDELRQKEEELNKLREKVQRDEVNRKEIEEQQTQLMEEKNNLFIQLQREQEQCAEAEENVQRLMAKKVDLEANLQEMVERLDEEVDNNANISAAKRKLEAQLEHIQQDLEDAQAQLEAVEQEKAQKEKDCMSLEAEIEKMNDSLTRVNKDKKGLEERLAEVTASLQAEEDKANRLNKLKNKLEGQVQETHDELEKEKREKAEVEKVRRKLEGDLKTTQEQVDNINRAKEELERTLSGKENEILSLQQKGEDDASEIASLQRRIRDLEAKIQELDEDLENEKRLRQRVEKQKNELLKDLEQLQDRIEETGGVAMAQTELSKKREAELQKMQADAQAQAEEHDRTVADMRKKHQQSVNGLQEQLDTTQKAKSRLEKERSSLTNEVGDLTSSLEDLHKAKSNTDKRFRSVEEQLNETTAKVNDYEASLAALQSAQAKATSENSELSSQLSEAESKLSALTKEKNALDAQVEDLQSELQSETSAKQDAQSKLRNMTSELSSTQESLEEEQEAKATLQKQLMAAKNDANTWKNKFETEATPKIEELEDSK
jgi:myosin heavy chain 6/7